MPKFLNQTLWEYPQKVIDDSVRSTLSNCLDFYGGVLPLARRYAGRSFCKPGGRLRLHPNDLFPKCLGGTGLDEEWDGCTTPIVTGNIDQRTGEAPFREGQSHVITPAKNMVLLQHLIEESPELIIGTHHADFTRVEFGHPTWGIVSKKFDNKNDIPLHAHWAKWEVYDVNAFDNPDVHPSHYCTTGMGFFPWVKKKDLLDCLTHWGEGEYNGIRHLSPHVLMKIGHGFTMPNGIFHSPTRLCHHEVHVTMDEHVLIEDRTQDGRIPIEAAFLACRPEDYPPDRHGDWEYLVSKIDLASNQYPNFVNANSRPPIPAREYLADGVDAQWIVYGDFEFEQRCSILRLTVVPGTKTTIDFRSPGVFHTNQGMGRIGNLTLKHEKQIRLGRLHYEVGFITQQAVDDGPTSVENTGEEPFVFTVDFPQDAFDEVPGAKHQHQSHGYDM